MGGNVRRFFGGGGSRARFKKNDVVQLEEGAPHANLPAGSIGLVMSVYADEKPSYEVEFLSATGAVLDRTVVKEARLSPVEDV